MTPTSFRALCTAPAQVFLLAEDRKTAVPFATAKAGRTYPVLGHRVTDRGSILVLDPVAFGDVKPRHYIFVVSEFFEPLKERQTNIDSLRAIAAESSAGRRSS